MNMKVSPSIGDASNSKRGAGKPGRTVSGVLPLLWLCASAKRRWMRQWQLIDLRWSHCSPWNHENWIIGFRELSQYSRTGVNDHNLPRYTGPIILTSPRCQIFKEVISRSTWFQVSVSDLIFNGLQWLITEKHEDYTMFGTHQWAAI